MAAMAVVDDTVRQAAWNCGHTDETHNTWKDEFPDKAS